MRLFGSGRRVVTETRLSMACHYELVPSSTPGHSHLYLDVAVPWYAYVDLLRVMCQAGIVEEGFYSLSKHRGLTCVRLPWVQKETATVEHDQELRQKARELARKGRAPGKVPGALDRRTAYWTTEIVEDQYSSWTVDHVRFIDDLAVADLVTSKMQHGKLHAPVIDLDVPHSVDPLSGQLVIDVPMTYRDHRRVIRALERIGAVHDVQDAPIQIGRAHV